MKPRTIHTKVVFLLTLVLYFVFHVNFMKLFFQNIGELMMLDIKIELVRNFISKKKKKKKS